MLRIIARSTLLKYCDSLKASKDYRPVKSALAAWYHEAKSADWASPADVKRHYRNVSIIGVDRLVFNIKGNEYRLVVAANYKHRILFIKWIGTHAQYDRIDVSKVEYADQTD